MIAHKKIITNNDEFLFGDSEYTTTITRDLVQLPTRAQRYKIISIQKQVLAGCYNFSPVKRYTPFTGLVRGGKLSE